MIKVDNVINFLENKKQPILFDEIWSSLKDKHLDESKIGRNEFKLKSNLYSLLIIDERLIMVKNNFWDLRERYSLDEIAKINKSNLIEETTQEEISSFEDETQETPIELEQQNEEKI